MCLLILRSFSINHKHIGLGYQGAQTLSTGSVHAIDYSATMAVCVKCTTLLLESLCSRDGLLIYPLANDESW